MNNDYPSILGGSVSLIGFLENIKKVLTSAYGIMSTAVISVLNYFAPERFCFLIVLIFVGFDFIWGVAASKVQRKFVLSYLLRETVKKLLIYSSALIAVYMAEDITHHYDLIGIKVVTTIICACEFWSTSASMLIVKPDMPFLKIFRLQLRGEIEHKLGKNVDAILKDDDNGKEEENNADKKHKKL